MRTHHASKQTCAADARGRASNGCPWQADTRATTCLHAACAKTRRRQEKKRRECEDRRGPQLRLGTEPPAVATPTLRVQAGYSDSSSRGGSRGWHELTSRTPAPLLLLTSLSLPQTPPLHSNQAQSLGHGVPPFNRNPPCVKLFCVCMCVLYTEGRVCPCDVGQTFCRIRATEGKPGGDCRARKVITLEAYYLLGGPLAPHHPTP